MNVIEPAGGSRNPFAATPWERFFTKGREQPLWIRMLCAMVWTVVIVSLRLLLQPFVGELLSYDFPIVFILIVAWSAGVWPALMVLVVSFAVTDYMVPPANVAGHPAFELWEIVHFLATATVGIVLIESLHRARHRTALQRAALDEEVRLHQQTEKKLLAARQALCDYANCLEATVNARTAALSESLHFQKDFCYALAHDLRAPLRAILGFTDLLAEKRYVDVTAADWDLMDRVHQAALRMDRLVNGLIELGTIASVSVTFRQVDLDKTVASVLAQTAHSSVSAGGEMVLGGVASVDVEAPLGTVWTDEGMVQCVLRELIENAIRFARPGVPPRIRIRTKKGSNVTTLCVCDNGMGIEKKYHKKIFGCFQTLQKHETLHPGTGLALVAEAVRRIHAIVRVESEPGEGACFQIDLPQRAPDEPPATCSEICPSMTSSSTPQLCL